MNMSAEMPAEGRARGCGVEVKAEAERARGVLGPESLGLRDGSAIAAFELPLSSALLARAFGVDAAARESGRVCALEGSAEEGTEATLTGLEKEETRESEAGKE